ncbi:hypothetical protein IWQ62_001469 [Dispira parvispora]|uniref:Uncharacterized protein n=1 Tax=Dispira parvispora TaxID=1520584 RepID=A0A9W8E4W9_9FUNG|nr:hypothetical protein IWQ62_001469 [Dispira parvispora]
MDLLNRLTTKHQSSVALEENPLRILLPALAPRHWLALPLLEWPHIHGFKDPAVTPFHQPWSLAASSLIHTIYVARNDNIYQCASWPTTRLTRKYNATLKAMLINNPKPSYPLPLKRALQALLPDPETGIPPPDSHHLRPHSPSPPYHLWRVRSDSWFNENRLPYIPRYL